MNNVQPDEVKKPAVEQPAKRAGEGREPERAFTVADQFSIKLSKFKDIADLFSARADNLFKENQKRAKALGTKGFDKTSSLYRQWYKTTQVVRLADKIANIYQKGAEATAEELTQAEALEKEVKDARIELDLTREEAWDESAAAKELTDRWTGIELPKQKSAAELVSDIYLQDSSVNKDKFALEERRAAEKTVQEQAALQRQIATAKKEADRIAAEQKEAAKIDKYEKSISGPVGWLKRLFKSKEQKAADAAAREQAELTRAGVEADTALETKWTEADEKKQMERFKPGILQRGLDKRGLDVVESTIANVRARVIDKRLDKKLAKEKATVAELEDWKEEVDESVAKQGIVDKVLSRFDANPEKQGAKMLKKMDKAEAKEAARLTKWGKEADADMARKPMTDEAESAQLKPGIVNRVLDKAENAIINAQARGIDKKLDKKLARERAAVADLDDWKEEVDESVAKQGIVDKVLSRFDANPEKQGAKMMERQAKTEAATQTAIGAKVIKLEKRRDERTKADQDKIDTLKRQAA